MGRLKWKLRKEMAYDEKEGTAGSWTRSGKNGRKLKDRTGLAVRWLAPPAHPDLPRKKNRGSERKGGEVILRTSLTTYHRVRGKQVSKEYQML